MHHCSSGTDQLGKEAERLGLPAPLSRSPPVCSRSSPLLPLCAQTFPCVPRLLLVCSSCLNGCPCVPSPTANTKTLTSGRQTVKPSKRREQLSSLGLAFRSGVFWVFCGLYANAVPAGCLPCDRAWPAPLLGPGRGSGCCPAQGFSHHSRDCVTPEHQSTPHRDLHHESMSQKFENTFPIPTNPEYNWFEELLKMLSDRAGQGLKTP